jgi:hypothetical protein
MCITDAATRGVHNEQSCGDPVLGVAQDRDGVVASAVGRAAAKVTAALPGLNGRVVFGSFAPSPTIDRNPPQRRLNLT